jgi:uncharacterized protein YjiS (DUF1127 family)
MTRIFAWLRRAYWQRQTRRQLHALSDYMLRDIGLRRDEIASALLERHQSSSS